MTAEYEIKKSGEIAAEVAKNSGITLSVDCVLFGFDEGALKILLIESDYDKYYGQLSLLGDLVRPNEDLDSAAQRVLYKRTGLTNIFLEQVTTFGNTDRHPEGRVVTVAYCALVNVNNYQLKINDNELKWVEYKELEKMAFDHMEIAKASLHWLQKQIHTEPIIFNLLPKKFSLRELQNLYTAVLGETLDRRNFRKKIMSLGYIKDTGQYEKNVTHRPGRLFSLDKANTA